ncbi:MAG TPA: chemotaxis protein CheW [Myxococcales bacterium]
MSVLHVVFKVSGSEYALAAADVLQMESYSGATPVPGSKSWVSGIIQVRGRIVPVLDVRGRFGLPPQDRTVDSRVVVATHGERAVALLVDSAREVLKLEPEQLKPPPQVVAQEAKGLVKAVAQVGPRLVMLLDLGKLMEEE